jgi:uncharacterized membrane protein
MPVAQLDPVPRSRILSLDAQRGLIMVIMAIDHAAFFVAKHHPGEFWGLPLPVHPNWASFLTRHISHLCAPGFFLLMGAGIVLFGESRRQRGWSEARIARHFVVRGIVLLLVQQVLENPAWIIGSVVPYPDAWFFRPSIPGEPGPLMLVLAVLSALGAALIIVGLLQKLPGWALGLAGIGAIVLSQAMVPGPEMARVPFSPLLRLTFAPGQTGILLVMYPIVPWLGVTLLGAAFGKALSRDRDRTLRLVPLAGLGLVGLFIALRLIGGFGNTHPWDGDGLMNFLNMTKYPPSIVFLSFAVGTNLLLIGLFEWITPLVERYGGWLLTFGRTALFFYILHIWLYMLMGLPFRHGTGFGVMYLIWAIGLLILLPLCTRYERFKSGKPAESVWRLF